MGLSEKANNTVCCLPRVRKGLPAARKRLGRYQLLAPKTNLIQHLPTISRCSAVGSALGSGPRGHGFESRHFDQIRTQKRIQLFVPILRFLLLFREIFTLSIINFMVFDKKSLSSFGFATSGDRLFLLSLKLWVFVKFIVFR